MTYITDYKLDDTIYESEERHQGRRESALYAMRVVFENNELIVGGIRRGVDDLMVHIAESEQLDEEYKRSVMMMVRGVNCGKTHIDFWNEAAESYLDTLVDEWMENP